MFNWIPFLGISALLILSPFAGEAKQNLAGEPGLKETLSPDNVKIAYQSLGSGDISLVFIHGGFADKGHWRNQVKVFSKKFQVIAVDLGGHGQSGTNRKTYRMKSFAADVLAVMEKEKVKQAILIGSSLGGTVALEVAALIPKTVIGIVVSEALNDFETEYPENFYKNLAQNFRTNFKENTIALSKTLFHGGEKHWLYPEMLKQMLNFRPDIAASVIESFEYHDLKKAIQNVPHPIRCINGNLYPIRMEKNREVHRDFDGVVIPDTGHLPMLERPELFNKHLKRYISEFIKK